MPLQANARKNNNSMFIDENFQPYDDQWSFLSNIRVLSDEDIDTSISQLGGSHELGDLKQSEDVDIRPWEGKGRIVN